MKKYLVRSVVCPVLVGLLALSWIAEKIGLDDLAWCLTEFGDFLISCSGVFEN